MPKIIKTIFFTIILSIAVFVLIVATRDMFFKPMIHRITVIKGTDYLEGDDYGMETISISLKIIFPIILFISSVIVHKLMVKKNKP